MLKFIKAALNFTQYDNEVLNRLFMMFIRLILKFIPVDSEF